MGNRILCSARTSRKRATERTPLGQLPDLSTTMAAGPTGPFAVVHTPSNSAKAQTAMNLAVFILAIYRIEGTSLRVQKSTCHPFKKCSKKL